MVWQVTMSTVGFGDISAQTYFGRLFMILFISIGLVSPTCCCIYIAYWLSFARTTRSQEQHGNYGVPNILHVWCFMYLYNKCLYNNKQQQQQLHGGTVLKWCCLKCPTRFLAVEHINIFLTLSLPRVPHKSHSWLEVMYGTSESNENKITVDLSLHWIYIEI